MCHPNKKVMQYSQFREKCTIFAIEAVVHNAMEYNIRSIIEYTIALVNEFAKRFNLSEKQAYRYIRNHNGIAFIEEHYGIIHTLSFDDVVDDIALICRKSGGTL